MAKRNRIGFVCDLLKLGVCLIKLIYWILKVVGEATNYTFTFYDSFLCEQIRRRKWALDLHPKQATKGC